MRMVCRVVVPIGRAFACVVAGFAITLMPALPSAFAKGGTGLRHLTSCRLVATVLARGFGSPDDLAVVGGHILFGDVSANVLAEIVQGKSRILMRNLNVPEGIAVTGSHNIVLVEQGLNRLDSIDLRTRRRHVLVRMTNTTGKEGVDSISRVGGSIIIPDSPYGTLLSWRAGRFHTLATGLSRPVDAIQYDGGFAIADEDANAIWLLKHGRVSRLAIVPTPDDVALVNGMLVAVTLGDGGLWEIRPHARRLLAGFNQPQGLVTTGRNTVAVASSKQNKLFRVVVPRSCAS